MKFNFLKYVAAALISVIYLSGCTTVPKNILKGDIKFGEAKYHWAIEYYSTAISESPGDPLGYLKRARAESMLGRHSEAIEDYESVLKIEGDHIPALISRGIEYMELSDYQSAENSIRLALVEDPYNKTAFFILGYVYSLRNDYEAAVFYYNRAVELDSMYLQALVNRANAKGILGNHNEAVADYTRAISINSTDENLFLARGFDKSKVGDITGAAIDFTRAVELNSTRKDALLLRSDSYRTLKKYKEAIEDLNIIIKVDSDPELFYRRGLIYAEMGKRREACSDFSASYSYGFAPSLDAIKEYCRR